MTRLGSRPRRALLIATLALSAAGGGVARAQDGLGIPSRPEEPPPGGGVEAKKLTKVPKQTKFVEAEYPKEAQDKGIEADVTLLLDINAEGKVDSVGITEPANPPGLGFDEAALIAAQQFEFEPAEMDGKKIAVQIGYKYKFRLKPKAPPPAPAAEAPRPRPPPRRPPAWSISRASCASAAPACRCPGCW